MTEARSHALERTFAANMAEQPVPHLARRAIDCCQEWRGSASEPLATAFRTPGGPEDRRILLRVLVSSATLAILMTVQGCTLNSSSLHSDLSDAELSRRVSQRFYRGMPGPQVIETIERNHLKHGTGRLPSRSTYEDEPADRGVRVELERSGLQIGGVKGVKRTGESLMFWFDDTDHLEQIAFQRRNHSRAAGTPRYRIDRVLLREAPQ